MPENAGTVCLVGAGPGDPGLITVRGVDCLRRANVVIYDRLAHPDLLRHAPESAESIYVGKESARHTMTQDEINRLIVDRASMGKTVCRLKGGDPFVFGRGGEEAEACREAGISFEVVPGISSAIAGPAYAGIPVTHRNAASSFAVITGHEDPSKPESRIRWEHLAHGVDTLVFLMGVENLPNITRSLLDAGRSPDTPVALVRWATWPKQETLVTTLGSAVSDVAESGFKAPAVTIVGDVVNLRQRLRWFDTRPLFGRRILVTRAREQASALSEMLRELGAEPVEFPVIRVRAPDNLEDLDSAVSRLHEFDWSVFTSVNAVRSVVGTLKALDLDARRFGKCRIAAIGPATRLELEKHGLLPDFIPARSVSESVIEEWPEKKMAGRKVLIPQAKEGRELLRDEFRRMGAEVTVITAYVTEMDAQGAEGIRSQLEAGEIDAVTFTSSSTVTNFAKSIDGRIDLLEKVFVAAIGPITSQTAREQGIRVDAEGEEHTVEGLVEALTARLSRKD